MIRPFRLFAAAGLILGLAISAFASDQALLILKSQNYSDTNATVDALEKIGAHADHVFPPNTIIAYVPAAAEAGVRSLSNVASFYRGPAPAPADGDSDLALNVGAWNFLLAPKPAATKTGSPLIGDAIKSPRTPAPAAASTSTPAAGGLVSHAPSYYETSTFLAGKVAVGVVLPESKGNGENWSKSQPAVIFNEIVAGMNWWCSKKRASTPLTFVYDRKFSIPTSYEPINESGDYAWMSDVLKNMGYTDSDAYVNDIRTKLKTDWAFVYYVVNSYNDGDGTFPSGYFAYACVGGPYSVMTYDNDGWGIDGMDLCARHEMGHIFNCGDEYCSPGYACCDMGYWGYLGVYNGNCELGNPNSITCVMKNDQDAICEYTWGQIGWTDTDNDGIPDVVDNTVNVTLDPIPVPVRLPSFTFSGVASNVPCPSPVYGPVTINKISSVKYRIDGADWADATATDGAFNLDAEQFNFTTPTLANGHHKAEIQATSTVSGNTSDILTYEFDVTDPDLTPPTITEIKDGGDISYDDTMLIFDIIATDPDSGIYGYQYAIGTTPTDPGSGYVKGWTNAGFSSHIVVDGLSLVSGQTYYMYAKVKNASDIWSDVAASDGIKAVSLTIALAKQLPDGTKVTLKDRIVTEGLSRPYNCIYIEDTNRSAGIRVRCNDYRGTGAKVTVKGTLVTASAETGYERQILADMVMCDSYGNSRPRPIALNSRSIVGGTLGLQPGLPLSSGLNNVGLLVRMVGKITRIVDDHFYISDGSVYTKVVYEDGVKKLKTVPVEVYVYQYPYYGWNVGDYIIVTGVVGIDAPNGLDETAMPMIKPNLYDDIIKL